MPVLKTLVAGEWVPLVAGRDGAQGKPGPASPHEGSNIAVGVRQHGAVGDGVTDDTAAIQAAINAAGSYGFVDFEAGTYLVTSALSSWLNIRKTGPGALTNGAITTYVTPRWALDYLDLWVDGDNGSDLADGMFPHSAFKTLARLDEAFEKMDQDQVQRGQVLVHLSGTVVGGHRFRDLPVTKMFIRFKGEDVVEGARPLTWIESAGDPDNRFGMRFEEGQNQRIELENLGFRGFNTGGGAGWIMKSGGFIRTRNCWTEDCQIGSLYTGNVGFSELYGEHVNYQTSGSRAQYNSSGSWTEVKMRGGANAYEGFHTSRQSVTHVDKCISENNTIYGAWSDMSTRVSYAGSTFRNNGSRGIRGEGSSDVHIDDSTYGPNVFENNNRQNVSIRGTSRHLHDEGIYATPEHLVDSRHFSARTTSITADRGLRDYRIGQDVRMRLRAWGDSAGTLTITGGGTTFGAITVPAGNWVVELVAQHTGSGWQTYATVNNGAPEFGSVAAGSSEILPDFAPSGGAQLRGIEVRTGG